MKPDRFVKVKAYEVVVPSRPGAIDSEDLPFAFAYGRWDLQPIVLLELTSESGWTGLGEASRGWTLASLEPWLKQITGILFSGTAPDPSSLSENWRPQSTFPGLLDSHPQCTWNSPSPLWPALETALLDIAGKKLSCRAVDLLGGAVRGAVSVDYWAGRQTPADLARTTETAKSRGFRGIKIKARLGDPTIEQLHAIRDTAGPKFLVTIDPMFQWLSPHRALGLLKALEAFADQVRVEDPFPQDALEMWRRARQVCVVPLVFHARSVSLLRRALVENVADAFNCGGGGSVREFMAMASTVGALGFDCWQGSALELGVMQAARLHAAAAAPACVMCSDLQGAIVREGHLTDWDWHYRDGMLSLPDRPGLGMDLDHHAVKHFLKAEAVFAA